MKFLVHFEKKTKTPLHSLEILQQMFSDHTTLRAYDLERRKRFEEVPEEVKIIPGTGGFQQTELKTTSSG